MNPLSRLLFAAALLLGLVGVGVAVVQPGDLGDHSSSEAARLGEGAGVSGSTSAAPPSSSSSSSATTSSTTSTPTSGVADDDEPSPPVGGSASGADPAPPDGGSGLTGSDDTPDDLDDGLVATGGTSTVGVALAAAAAGLALRRCGPGKQRSHG